MSLRPQTFARRRAAWRRLAPCLLLALLAAACGSQANLTPSPPLPAATTPITTPAPPGAVGGSPSPAAPSATPPAASATPPATATEGGPLGVETPTPPPSPTITPTPTATEPCRNGLTFVADVTVPDGSQFLPGQPIDKQWRVTNSGTCDWTANYRLVLVSGNALGPRSEVALFPARAGSEAVLQVPMQAPAEPGDYTGRWQARDPDGNLFGDRIFITIQVIPLPATEPPAEPEG